MVSKNVGSSLYILPKWYEKTTFIAIQHKCEPTQGKIQNGHICTCQKFADAFEICVSYGNLPSQSMEALKATFEKWAQVRYDSSFFGPKEGGLHNNIPPFLSTYKVTLCNLTLKYWIQCGPHYSSSIHVICLYIIWS